MGRLRIVFSHRKLQKTEGQRRSLRLSTLVTKANDHLDNKQGPTFRTRGKKNTKLRTPPTTQTIKQPNILAIMIFKRKVVMVSKIVCHFMVVHNAFDLHMVDNESDKSSKFSSSIFLPEKQILQLLLDTLQRKDTYEIFVEPVDPNEVNDYYATIEEPMDFGTIRAKLHKKMYKTLEQFEVNNLLLCIYRYHDVFKYLTMQCVLILLVPYILGSFKTNCLDAKDAKITIGIKEYNKSESFEIDRRGMYKPFYIDKDKSILPTINGELRLLQHVGQQDIGYKDSLMLFAKDLGPIAQNIAKMKFLGCEILKASASAPCKTEKDTFNIVTTSSMISYHLDNVSSYPNTISLTDNVEKQKGCNPLKGYTWRHYKWCDKECLSKRFSFEPCYSWDCLN
ncbi:hypothetical protein V8G54_009207 [Vigna mungo]|uniref:Bromo domain-containing protein n=1 Tax=Vigna mungo TaxID=3915 RepID=A0AAQ3NVP2_VIGMU